MPRRELNPDDLRPEQKADIDLDHDDRQAKAIEPQKVMPNKEHLAKLAFNEEPVTIRLEPTSAANAATHHRFWNQGIPAEVMVEGRWKQWGWLPVNQIVTVKRKTVEQIARARVENIKTHHDDATVERPRNMVERRTTMLNPMSVIQDANPAGHDWLMGIYAEK